MCSCIFKQCRLAWCTAELVFCLANTDYGRCQDVLCDAIENNRHNPLVDMNFPSPLVPTAKSALKAHQPQPGQLSGQVARWRHAAG